MDNTSVMDAGWFDVQKNPEYIKAAEEAKKHREAYIQKKEKILENWERSALDINVSEMIIRFKTKYTTEFYRTKEKIDQDLNQLRVMHKSVGMDIEDTQIIDMLQALTDINTEKKWFEENDSRIRAVVPAMYQGIDTDWDNVLLTICDLSAEATGHQGRIWQLMNQVLSAWESEVLNIDSSGMLDRFKTKHVGVFHKIKASYKDDMRQMKLLSKYVGTQLGEDQVIAVLQILNEIRQEKQWFLDNAERYKAQIPSYYRAEDTDWERVNREVRTIIDEAKTHQAVIKEKTGRILENWELDVFDIDPADILRQFREEYTRNYRETNDLYNRDISYLMSLSKHVGEKVTADGAIELLRVVDEVNIEKEWYQCNDARLKVIFKANYDGLNTDWDKMIIGIRVAMDVAIQISGTDIPEKTVQAILKTIESPDKVLEFHRLSDALTEERVMKCANNVRISLSLESEPIHSSLSNRVMIWLKEAQNREAQLEEYIKFLDFAKKEGNVYWQDLKELINELDALSWERQWFICNTRQFGTDQKSDGQIKSLMDFAAAVMKRYAGETPYVISDGLKELFGDRYSGMNTDWQGIVRDIDAISAFEEQGATDAVTGLIEAVSNDSEKRAQAAASLRRIHELIDDLEDIINLDVPNDEKCNAIQEAALLAGSTDDMTAVLICMQED